MLQLKPFVCPMFILPLLPASPINRIPSWSCSSTLVLSDNNSESLFMSR